MKKSLFMLFLCLSIVILPFAGLSAEIINHDNFGELENDVAYVTLKGTSTGGVSYAVRDLYFDGYLFMVNVTQIPNDPVESVYEDESFGLSDDEKEELLREPLLFGERAVGSFCDVTITDKDGEEINSMQRASTQRIGNSISETFAYRFLPHTPYEELIALVSYGVVETPGNPDISLEGLEFDITVQDYASTREVEIAKNDAIPTLRDVFVSQTNNLAGIYLYHDNHTSPIEFVEDAIPATSYEGYDDIREMGYSYQAVHIEGELESIRVLDKKSRHTYEINLNNGSIVEVQ